MSFAVDNPSVISLSLGDASVEFDALPVDVSRTRIVAKVNKKLREKIRENTPHDRFERFAWS